MIYMFLSDESFASREAQSSVMSVDDIQKYGLGIIDDNLLNYFIDHNVITDPVGSERASNRTARVVVDLFTGVTSSVRASGRMYLNFDASKISEDETSKEHLFIQSITIDAISDSDSTIQTKIQRRAALFNIIETIFFSRSSVQPYSLTNIENTLASAPNTTYAGYVKDSLQLSTTITQNSVYYYTSVMNGGTLASDALDFYDFAIFKFQYGSTTDDVVELKVWLSVPQFKANYPYSTITDIVYPCKPEWILNPTSYQSQMDAVLQSADYKDNVLDVAVTSKDHSGLVVYKTRYVHSSVPHDASMGFVVLYKGAVPSAEAMRDAIRESLLNEKNSVTGGSLATESEWKEVLPDLFIDSSFYIFPCYYQRVKYGSSMIEQSISSYRTMYDRLRRVFTSGEYTEQELFDNMEILQAPGHGMYLIAIAADLNEQKHSKLLEIHPTYQPLDSVGTVTEFAVTSDTVFLKKTYYKKTQPGEIYEFTEMVEGKDYHINDIVPQDGSVYEKIVLVEKDDWNTMTSTSKTFAWMLAKCIAACIEGKIDSTSADFLTEEMIGVDNRRQFYYFTTNFTAYHVMTLEGAKGIFDITTLTDEDEEHVPGYIH